MQFVQNLQKIILHRRQFLLYRDFFWFLEDLPQNFELYFQLICFQGAIFFNIAQQH